MRVKTFFLYLGTALLSGLILFYVMDLSQADLNIPFAYEWRDMKTGQIDDRGGSGDAMSVCAGIKGMRDASPLPMVGAPGTAAANDWPSTDKLHEELLKLLTLVTPNFAVTMNLFFLLGFPLTALATLWSFRQLGVGSVAAAVGSLLFTFLPYHFIHGQQHLFLASYYLVGPMSLVALWLGRGEKLLVVTLYRIGESRAVRARLTRNGFLAILICGLVGCAGIYYAFFGAFLACAATVLQVARKRPEQADPGLAEDSRWQTLVSLFATIGTMVLALFGNLLPHLLYTLDNGANPAAAPRFAFSAEYFALKIIQLLLPICQHRLHEFAFLSGFYARTAVLVNENSAASLGLLGSFGFLCLVLWQIGVKWRMPAERLFSQVGSLNICAVLMATIGGFGALFAYTISPSIRCYGRMSIYIGFFSLLALLLLLEQARLGFATTRLRRIAFGIGMGGLLLFGIWDQTTPAFAPLYAENAASWKNDEQFVQRIEGSVPKGAMIFQLPYVGYPEGAVYGDYQLFRGYLHSAHLRWSYGAMRGRPADLWVRKCITGVQDINQFASRLRAAGFKGIYVDRKYFSEAQATEGFLKTSVDPSPLVSGNGRLAFYKL